jgi:hypothetical protein
MVNDLASQGKLTAPYTRTMRAKVREQLQSTSAALTEPHSTYGNEIEQLLAQPQDARPQQLRAHAEKLKQIEDELESA